MRWHILDYFVRRTDRHVHRRDYSGHHQAWRGIPVGVDTFLAGLVFVGLKLIQSQLRERNALRQINEEQLILSRAKTKGGSLTVSDAALECKLGISDTKKAFERLALTGVCRVDVNDAGELFYWFPTFEKSKQIQSGGLLSEDATITLSQSEKNPS